MSECPVNLCQMACFLDVRRHCPERTVIVVTSDPRAEEHFRALSQVSSVERNGSEVILHGRGEDLLTNVVGCLAEHRIHVADFRTEVPTLEDVFLRLTGRGFRD